MDFGRTLRSLERELTDPNSEFNRSMADLEAELEDLEVLAKSFGVDETPRRKSLYSNAKMTPREFMAKAMDLFREGRLSSDQITQAEVAIGAGRPVPHPISQIVAGANPGSPRWFMDKAMEQFRAGKLTSDQVTQAEAAIGAGREIPDHIVRAVMGADYRGGSVH
jgi:hypothetical protein